MFYLQNTQKSVSLHCVFHSIRFKVNKGWSTAVLLFLCPYVSSIRCSSRNAFLFQQIHNAVELFMSGFFQRLVGSFPVNGINHHLPGSNLFHYLYPGQHKTVGSIIYLLSFIGILVASIGMDVQTGRPRFDFGNIYLLGGVEFIPFVIGTVGFAQLMQLMDEKDDVVHAVTDKLTIRGSMLTAHDWKRLTPPSIRAGVMGTFVGVLPGAGATAASFLAYAMQKAFKSEEPLGTGAIEGIAASESANNAAAAGSFAPLLALGIPGSGTGAVLLGGLMMWGLNPGPLLFQNEPDFAWGLIASLFISNIVALAISLGIIPVLLKILKVPVRVMIPVIMIVCFLGAYASTYSMFGVIVMLISGVCGYIFEKNDYSTAPMLLAFVLAPLLEDNMRKAFIATAGDISEVFFSSGISIVLTTVLIVICAFPVVRTILIKTGKYTPKKKSA